MTNKRKQDANVFIGNNKGGKRIRSARTMIDQKQIYHIDKALDLVKTLPKAKFDESIELALQLGVDPKHSDQMVRGIVQLPHGTGKSVRIAVIAKEERHAEAKEAGADLIGAEDLIDQIRNGKIDFDICIATPDVMGLIGSVAKILGPKGLMPNPKLGTVTLNIADAVKAAKAGQVEFRVEKAGIIHVIFGKISFEIDQLKKNLNTIVSAVTKAKPSTAKGTYLQHAHISSTMGPSLAIDISSVYQ